jgi:hypothetical protein
MKNFLKLFGIIAVVAVIGFSMAACDDGSGGGGGGGGGGTFTLTGIPAKYNGMYASFFTSNGEGNIYGGNDVSIFGPEKGTRISNGKVSIPVWFFATANGERYKGNDTLDIITIFIIESEEAGMLEAALHNVDGATYHQVTFSNGSATRAWSEADNKSK